jgi:OOP family OmpA-OmpF porin
MFRVSVLKVAVALSLFAASAAHAQEGIYVQLGAGQARIDEARLGIDDNDTAYQGLIGYRFNRYLGVEAGYVTLGKQEDTVRIGGTTAGLSAEAKGFTLGVSGKYAFGESNTGFFILGRAGAMRSTFEGTFNAGSVSIPVATRFDDEDKWTPYYGLGAGYDFDQNMGVSVTYINHRVGDRLKSDVGLAMASFEYRF